MSTFPLVQVEGALAMPHMRPLYRVPPPFGREWALMPSQFSLRTELHALYAAFLRTICLSAEAFRQAYRWDRQPRSAAEPPRPTAAPVGAAMSAAQAQQAAAGAIGGRGAASAKPQQAMQPAGVGRAARTPPPSHKLTASAVAVSGAALLAWIVASHTQFGGDKSESVLRTTTSPTSNTEGQASAPLSSKSSAQSASRLSDERALHDRSISGVIEVPQAASANDVRHESGVAIGSAVVAQRATAAFAPAGAPAPAPAVAPAAVPAAAPALATGQQSAITMTMADASSAGATNTPRVAAPRPDFTLRTAQNKPREETIESSAGSQKHTAKATRHQDAKASEQIGHRRHALHEFTPDRSAPLVTTHRTHGMYSEAAEYSPHQFAANSSDEYPSVSTYANTRTVSSAVSRAPVAADSTDWVNHVAQRRVTEVPDRFAK